MPHPRKALDCPIERHPLIAQIDEQIRARTHPKDVWRWVNNETPDDQVSLAHMEVHTRRHMGVKAKDIRGAKIDLREDEKPPRRPPSERLGRDVTDDDIEQRLKRRFYDSIDNIPPEKVAELMIEREKTKARALATPAKTPKEKSEDLPLDVQELRDAAKRTLGPATSRTSARRRAS